MSKPKFVIMMLLLFVFAGCKSTEQRQANYYQPVFDHTRNEYVKTPSSKVARLDTTVLIRSNLRETVVPFVDTLFFDEDFELEFGELNVPLDLINEKPPSYDTFLVAREYLYNIKLIDLLFPVIPDSLKALWGEAPDSSTNNIQAPVDTLVDVSDEQEPQHRLLQTDQFSDSGRMDSLTDIKAPLQAADKAFLTFEEVLADTTRDLLDADSILYAMNNEAPWRTGDSIPFIYEMPALYLDSTLLLLFDTVYVEIFDSTKIVPQLPLDSLSKEYTEIVNFKDTMYIDEEVRFKIFYPEDVDVFIEMVRVQGGTFKMGSNIFDEDERPETQLRISSFLMSKYEVTNSLFCFFLNDMECDSLGYIDGTKVINLDHPLTRIRRNEQSGKFFSYGGYEEHPVVNVTWNGAQMFCHITGSRLPSEAEWEYAARGGVYARKYYSGGNKKDFEYVYRYAGSSHAGDVGWLVDNSRGQVWVGGRKIPNELGIYDMTGNVWEWCYDRYNKEFYKQNNDSSDPICMTGPPVRVNRGGSWSSDATFCRVNNRNFLREYEGNPYLGFRYMRKW
ncbi:formylglycine-generating enzyme family protein [Roseimarinus sediminis]|uniref:formylglycine-generating enzyme family protein n=1 Tax=Roseimarinus sediminis TaxID=1610899 RepID=UPI003D245082